MPKSNNKRRKEHDEIFCRSCGENIKKEAELCPYCGVRQSRSMEGEKKSKTVAGLLGIFLGGLGLHKFYLGRIGLGVLYLLFCWTFIPSLIGLIEGIIYLTMTDSAFHAKYG